MAVHLYKQWKVIVLPSLQHNGLWTCQCVLERQYGGEVSKHMTGPAGAFVTKEKAEAGALGHAREWIDAQELKS